MKSFFSKKLYWEGFKKIRMVGVAFTAISAVLCGLIPFISMLEWLQYEKEYRTVNTVSITEFSTPALLMIMPAALIIVLNMFSYLNKRSESDFYHAIPYKRSCVYISFMTACLSWLAIASICSIAAAAFFWWIHPGATVAFSIPLLNLGVCFLLGATLAATTAVAMTLTGTSISNLLIFVLLLCFVPVVGFLFITALNEIVPMLYVPLTPARFLQPQFSMPLAALGAMTSMEGTALFNNAPMIIYTVIVTLLMLVAGCLIYMTRKSEMASKSAPNKFLQHVYRCAVSLPFALLAAMMPYLDGGEFALFIVLVVITLLVYFMYELITTKRFKNLAKAIPFLGVLLAGCLVFVGASELTKAIALSYTPEADELESIGQINSNEYGLYYDNYTYEDLKTMGIEIDSPEAFEIVSGALKYSVERAKDGMFYGNYDYEVLNKDEYEAHTFTTVKITDKSGKVCGRTLRISEKDYNRLAKLFLESEDYSKALIEMPTDSEVQNIHTYGFGYYISIDDADVKKLWRSMVDEYNSLTTEQKLEYKSNVMNSGMGYGYVTEYEETTKPTDSEYTILTTLDVSGTYGTKTFNSEYPLRSDLFPKTCAIYASIVNETEFDNHGSSYVETSGPADLREIIPLIESERMNAFSLNISEVASFYHDSDYLQDSYSPEQIEKLRAAVEFILNNAAPLEQSDRYVMLTMDIHLDEYDTTHANYSIVALSEENYQTFCQMAYDVYGYEES